jgi:hypothetical protein
VTLMLPKPESLD